MRFFLLALLLGSSFPGVGRAQTRRGLLAEAGPTVTGWGSRAGAYYLWHLSDQWVLDLGATHSMWFPREHPAGQLTAGGHVRYLIDVLRIVPSVHLGVGVGSLLDGAVPVTEVEYGLSADYMLSRRVQVGLTVSGVTAVFGEELSDDDGKMVGSVTRMQVLLRIQWVFGETW